MAPLAHPRHTLYLLPLLPSGPGGVRSTKLRGYQWSHQARIIPKLSIFSSRFTNLCAANFAVNTDCSPKRLSFEI